MKQKKTAIYSVYKQLIDEIDLLLKAYEIDAEKLKKPLSYEDKKALKEAIESWKEDGEYTGYFKMYVNNNKKRTYDDLVLIFIMYYFWLKRMRLISISKGIARQTADNTKEQAEEDYGGKLPDIPDSVINQSMFILRDNMAFDEYIAFMLCQDAEELMVNLRASILAKVKITKARLEQWLAKLIRKFISVKRDAKTMVIKLSGMLVHVIRTLANKLYIWLFGKVEKPDEKNILFIAEMDDRTTPMCKSLHLQRFSATGRNVFKRYSAEAGRVMTYDVQGMVEGVNLPAITDHFHWCRSRVMYIKERE